MRIKRYDLKKIWLEVRESNLNAIKLYSNIGFIQNGIRKNYYLQPFENAHIIYFNLIVRIRNHF